MHVRKALQQAHWLAEQAIVPGDVVVDATAGNGHDTVFLARLVGAAGCVHVFDIQQRAIDATAARLQAAGLFERCRLHPLGHEQLEEVVTEPVRLVLFNLGFLPGGDHRLFTHAETTIRAIRSAMSLLQSDGLILVVVYHGGDSGYEERDALLELVSEIDPVLWRVQVQRIVNWPNDPPFLIVIARDA